MYLSRQPAADERDRLRAEYEDQPTLRLTPSQSQRLLGSTPQHTAVALESLVADGFLRRTADGYFVRSHVPRESTLRHGTVIGHATWIRARHTRRQSPRPGA